MIFGKSDWFKIYLTPSWTFGWTVWETKMTSPQLCAEIFLVPFVGIRLGLKRCNCQSCKESRTRKK